MTNSRTGTEPNRGAAPSALPTAARLGMKPGIVRLRFRRPFLSVGLRFALAAFLVTGCQIQFVPLVPGAPSGFFGLGQRAQIGEPDDGFSAARSVTFGDDDAFTVTGIISPTTDVDVIDLGPILPGDRIVADLRAIDVRLDAVLAVFDDAGRLVLENDDRDFAGGDLNPLIDVTARHTGDSYFLGVAAVSGTGRYTLTVQVFRGGAVPPPIGQTVLLDFTGGTIALPERGTQTIPPFDAADIDEVLAGQTQALKSTIVRTVVENFTGFDLIILNTDEHTPPEGVPVSRVLLGGFSQRAFGASVAVDPYNTNPTDMAVVYTAVFAPNAFGRRVDIEDIGRAIGNVTAHEIGHLLGLNHVADPTNLMDTVGGPNTLLFNQDFGLAPLDVSIFPIGFQDAALLLAETVGPTP